MSKVSALCVYCGSSSTVDPRHLGAARETGRQAAIRGIEIVFGGGHVGMMGALADGALAEGGKVTGIIPEILMDREVAHKSVSEMIVVESMHTRKRMMFERSDAFCALPGGMGTLDETFEILTWKQLGLHDRPIVLANLGGYWNTLLTMLDFQTAAHYIRPEQRDLFQIVESIDAIFDALAAAPAPKMPSDSERF